MDKVKFLKEAGLLNKNYKGEIVPTGVGIIFVFISVFFWSIFLLLNFGNSLFLKKLIFLTLVTGCAGFIDDMEGTEKYRGLKGHIQAFLNGVITTGFLKGFAIFTASFLVLFTSRLNNYIIIDSGILILTAHFHNLLDLRPGRTLKFFTFSALILIMINPLSGIYILHIFVLILFYGYFELKSQVMLGDTGSYVLGIILGYITINVFEIFTKLIIFFLLLTMTILAERYSFSEFIEKNKFLNWFDMLGRKK